MQSLTLKFIAPAAIILLFLSAIAAFNNYFIYHYPGNHYLPPNTSLIAVTLFLIYLGFYIQLGALARTTQCLREIGFLFIVMLILGIATNAVQYTPFNPIDHQISAWESWLPFHLQDLMKWSHLHPYIHDYLEMIYLSLNYQMTYFPLLLIFLNRIPIIRDYYFLLLVSAIVGYGFYYFFPTTAPASILQSPYFNDFQKATGLKFSQIHHHIQPTTNEGGMIAMPSFHVIWAWFCVYLFREWPILFKSMCLINFTLIGSCVLLGWHYPMDIIGSVFVITISHALLAYCKRRPRHSTSRPTDSQQPLAAAEP